MVVTVDSLSVLPVLVVILACGALCVVYGIAIERRWFRLRGYALAILPPTGPERLVLHLSDLRRAGRRRSDGSWRGCAADVTVVTGDFLAGQAVENAVDAVRATRGRLASWFVLGSNDYFVPMPLNYFAYFRRTRTRRLAQGGRSKDLVAQLTEDGWVDLTNSRRELEVGGIPVELLGLDDAHPVARPPGGARTTNRFSIGVMLADSAPVAALSGPRSGRTHAWGAGVPAFVSALVTNCSMPPARRRLSRMGPAIVPHAGLGTSKCAVRFWCPEATILRLRRQPTLH